MGPWDSRPNADSKMLHSHLAQPESVQKKASFGSVKLCEYKAVQATDECALILPQNHATYGLPGGKGPGGGGSAGIVSLRGGRLLSSSSSSSSRASISAADSSNPATKWEIIDRGIDVLVCWNRRKHSPHPTCLTIAPNIASDRGIGLKGFPLMVLLWSKRHLIFTWCGQYQANDSDPSALEACLMASRLMLMSLTNERAPTRLSSRMRHSPMSPTSVRKRFTASFRACEYRNRAASAHARRGGSIVARYWVTKRLTACVLISSLSIDLRTLMAWVTKFHVGALSVGYINRSTSSNTSAGSIMWIGSSSLAFESRNVSWKNGDARRRIAISTRKQTPS